MTASAVAIRSEKLFRLRLDGKTSYILGTSHTFPVEKADFSEIESTLSEMDEVILEGDFRIPVADVDFRLSDVGPKPNYLRKLLSLGANRVLLQLVRPADRGVIYNLKPGAVLRIIKFSFVEEREKMLEEYFSSPERMTQEEIDAKYDEKLKLPEALHKAAEMLFGRKVSDEELMRFTLDHLDDPSQWTPKEGIDHHILKLAEEPT
jgi:hypothetical protein